MLRLREARRHRGARPARSRGGRDARADRDDARADGRNSGGAVAPCRHPAKPRGLERPRRRPVSGRTRGGCVCARARREPRSPSTKRLPGNGRQARPHALGAPGRGSGRLRQLGLATRPRRTGLQASTAAASGGITTLRGWPYEESPRSRLLPPSPSQAAAAQAERRRARARRRRRTFSRTCNRSPRRRATARPTVRPPAPPGRRRRRLVPPGRLPHPAAVLRRRHSQGTCRRRVRRRRARIRRRDDRRLSRAPTARTTRRRRATVARFSAEYLKRLAAVHRLGVPRASSRAPARPGARRDAGR